MRILFNVDALLSPPLTGVGHYAKQILTGLIGHGGDLDVLCFANMRLAAPPLGEAVVAAPPEVRQVGPVKRAIAAVPGVRRVRHAVRAFQARRQIPDTEGAIYHEPNHVAVPLRCAKVVTIHDLSVLHYPDMHPPERIRYFGKGLVKSAHEAARIITGSSFIKRDIVATLGIDPGKIRVVPYGVAPEFAPLASAEAREALDRYSLQPGGYLLAVGTREPRKNLERLLDAYLSLPNAIRAERPLVLAGPAGWRAEQLEGRLEQAERKGAVRRLGYIPDADRTALYAGAAAFAYPSLYEGFGLPPLEAVACGTPVLTSAHSPMEEVLGDAAVLVDPLDTGSIAAGLARLLADPDAAAEARRRGPARAARFTWASSVEGTIGVYREVAS